MSVIWNALNVFPNLADPRTFNWFLMSSPWPIIIITSLYVKFSTNWGPKWMKNREPFQIDRIVQIYDLFQVLFNIYMVYEGFSSAWLHYNWQCENIDYSSNPGAIRVAKWVYLFFLIKIVDLLDTVFFILRKKQNQVTGLHVYHHSSMILHVWAGVRFGGGGQYTLGVLVNSFIHAVMYGHYLVMSLKIWKPWWKKHLTELQILQFVILLVHMSQLWWVEDCGFPKWLSLITVPQNCLMIWMFGNFYYRAYVKKPSKEAGKNKDSKKTESLKQKNH